MNLQTRQTQLSDCDLKTRKLKVIDGRSLFLRYQRKTVKSLFEIAEKDQHSLMGVYGVNNSLPRFNESRSLRHYATDSVKQLEKSAILAPEVASTSAKVSHLPRRPLNPGYAKRFAQKYAHLQTSPVHQTTPSINKVDPSVSKNQRINTRLDVSPLNSPSSSPDQQSPLARVPSSHSGLHLKPPTHSFQLLQQKYKMHEQNLTCGLHRELPRWYSYVGASSAEHTTLVPESHAPSSAAVMISDISEEVTEETQEMIQVLVSRIKELESKFGFQRRHHRHQQQ
ncbi:hypothetical protein BJ741DRAFT_649309 [Chytriomyces cf. hyalinus JEL632]|nr:hypothetical protein BJ741DRAFT_649309 [Chytriomyces cf. hyalinus JEL632]